MGKEIFSSFMSFLFIINKKIDENKFEKKKKKEEVKN